MAAATVRAPVAGSLARGRDMLSANAFTSPWLITPSAEPGAPSTLTSSSTCRLLDDPTGRITPRSTLLSWRIIAQMLFLSGEDPEKDLQLYINSPGGSITAGLAIYDTMQFIKNNVVTYCIGQAASMGAFLLMSGTKGKRFALPNSRILIHQPSMGGLSGQATDIDIHAREILRIREITNRLMSKHTNQTLERIERDVERDFIMNANQAKEYGIIDEIIDRPRT